MNAIIQRSAGRRLAALGIASSLCTFIPGLGVGAAANEKLRLEVFVEPRVLIAGRDTDLMACVANRGASNRLVNDGRSSDAIRVTISAGDGPGDLLAFGSAASLGCVGPAGWDCFVDGAADGAIITMQPSGASIDVAAGSCTCFRLTGAVIEATEGVATALVVQDIGAERAVKLDRREVALFKAERGWLHHDDLEDVRSDQHHERYGDDEAFAAVLARDGAGSGVDRRALIDAAERRHRELTNGN